MFEPIRGGTRGGQGEFKWSDVSADKDRENYLGHSINAPTGRWQKNKDVHWYNRDKNGTEDERAAEIRKIKEAEEEALSIALGFAPDPKKVDGTVAASTSALRAPMSEQDSEKLLEKEEKRKRKEEKRAKKEARRAEKHSRRELEERDSRARSRSPAPRHSSHRLPPPRSESPRRPRQYSRSRSPPRRRSRSPPSRPYRSSDRDRPRDSDRRYERGSRD